MSDRLPGERLSDVPEENDALDALTRIEKLVAQGNLDAARQEYQSVSQELNKLYESRGGGNSAISEAIEDRLTKIKLRLDPPDPRAGDEV